MSEEEEPQKVSALSAAVTVFQWLVLGVVAAIIAVTIVVPRVMGAVPLTILTGSMSPTIEPGDIVVVKPVPTSDLSIGSVITFQPESDDPDLVTHRVVSVSIDSEGSIASLTTRGDANGADDDPIKPAQVKGKVVYTVPYVGYLTPSGYGRVIIPSILIAICASWGVQALVARTKNRTES